MPGRKTIPLFDLLSRTDPATSGLPRVGADRNGPRQGPGVGAPTPKAPPARGTVQTKPVVRVELKPQPSVSAAIADPAPQGPQEQAPAAIASSLPSGARSGRTITLPALVPFITIIVALAAIIATWTIAYRKGEASKETELQPLLQATRPPVLEPGTSGLSATSVPSEPSKPAIATASSAPAAPARPAANPAAPSASQPRASLEALESTPPATAAILTTFGWKTTEVRQVGLNYLNIATLRHKDAASAIFFLGQSGVEAFAVPLASGTSRGNTSPPVTYRVFVLPGITSEQYRARQSVMTNLEASVARLGRQWSRDQKGASDFRSPQWTKFDDK